MSAFITIQDRLIDEEFDEMTNLDLSDIPIIYITKEISQYLQVIPDIRFIHLNHCRLQSLENLPNWPRLQIFQATRNRLNDRCIPFLAKLTTIKKLLIAENNIETTELLSKFSTLTNLIELDMEANPVAEKSGYREILYEQQVFSLQSVKNLDIINRRNKAGKDLDYSSPEEEEEQDIYGSEFAISSQSQKEDSEQVEKMPKIAEKKEEEPKIFKYNPYVDEYSDESGSQYEEIRKKYYGNLPK